jgi:hypothetical protein
LRVSITVDNVHTFLMAQNLIAPEAVVDGDFETTSTPRRNRNLRATSDGFGSFLIKQPEQGEEQRASLEREARFYVACQGGELTRALDGLMPRVAFADRSAGILVLELVEDALPLWRHYEARTAEDFPVEVAVDLGRALAVVHSAFEDLSETRTAALEFLPDALPWALELHRPNPRLLAGLGPAGNDVLKLLQSEPALSRGLEETRGLWQCATVIHGDVKLDNILVRTRTPDGMDDCGAVCLVDWELLQYGDPAWDVGSALHDFMVWWIVTLPSASTVDEMVEHERYPLAVLRGGSQELWRGYSEGRAFEPIDERQALRRAVGYSAARLVQSAFELSGSALAVPPPARLMLQVASNMWKDLPAAADALYGLPSWRA